MPQLTALKQGGNREVGGLQGGAEKIAREEEVGGGQKKEGKLADTHQWLGEEMGGNGERASVRKTDVKRLITADQGEKVKRGGGIGSSLSFEKRGHMRVVVGQQSERKKRRRKREIVYNLEKKGIVGRKKEPKGTGPGSSVSCRKEER